MIEQGRLRKMVALPTGLVPLVQWQPPSLAAAVESLHLSIRSWSEVRLSPGPMLPTRVFAGADGRVAFGAADEVEPTRLLVNVGPSPDIAGWLVLLAKWVETGAVLESASRVWTPVELAGALPFVTPAFLPAELVALPPDNWVRVARALAGVMARPGL
ncbi:MAG: hypothetical protein ACRC1H_13595 [Caldilineaceae bacterium]